jgi:shikimate dehydrogenase
MLGFAASMREGLPGVALDCVLQAGAGGGGAATAHALFELGARKLLVCDADAKRSTTLVGALQRAYGPGVADAVPAVAPHMAGADGVVNATPVGMAASPGSPFDTALLTPQHWVADIVYFPLETELLRAARARGCRTLDGSGMAVYQAAAAFEIFTGRAADRLRMRQSFLEYRSVDVKNDRVH